MKRFLKIVSLICNGIIAFVSITYAVLFLKGPADQWFGLVPLSLAILAAVIWSKSWRKKSENISHQFILFTFLPTLLLLLVLFLALDSARDALMTGNK